MISDSAIVLQILHNCVQLWSICVFDFLLSLLNLSDVASWSKRQSAIHTAVKTQHSVFCTLCVLMFLHWHPINLLLFKREAFALSLTNKKKWIALSYGIIFIIELLLIHSWFDLFFEVARTLTCFSHINFVDCCSTMAYSMIFYQR